jgi:signal peptide peptidase SppA
VTRIKRAVARAADDGQILLERLDPGVPWAIRPALLPTVGAFMRRELTADTAAEQQLVPAAALRGQSRVAGAVAIIPLRGVITPRPSFISWLFGGGGGLEGFREDFRDAIDNDDVAAVLLDIDSPGGSVELVEETAAEILAARGEKPIVAIANTMAASAAYWIGAAADDLVVTPSGLVGSIGVYQVHYDFSVFNENLGVDPSWIAAGRFKVEGNEDEPLDDEARAAMQATVDDYYDLFVAAVASGRGVSESDVRSGFGEGRVLPSKRALAAGMVDRVATFEDEVSRLVNGGGTNGRLAATDEATRLVAAIADQQRQLLAEQLKTLHAVNALGARADDAVAQALRDGTSPLDALTEAVVNGSEDPPGGESTSPPPASEPTANQSTPSWLLPTPRRH